MQKDAAGVAIVIVFVSLSFGFVGGLYVGGKNAREEAIDKNLGRWVVDAKTGYTKFEWSETK